MFKLVGKKVVEQVTLYRVEVAIPAGRELRHYEDEEAAIKASGLYGDNSEPLHIRALKYDDGSYSSYPDVLLVSPPPSRAEELELFKQLTAAQKLVATLRNPE